MDLGGLFQWFQQQAQYVVYTILIIVLISCIWKRAWILAVVSMLGIGFVTIFVVNPQIIEGLSGWIATRVSIGG
ncbi:hypothetical protein H9655_21620 [Cytobacillus sp. Sa5YUA1]|uniref:Uncharacterized protein n=1 Tax=Cytobacillus stercorigallinarum TaxID=2762240 RepID=A0ABR8QVS6_9BACI|nr:hypothetical protein [Cytobacillus stercorigallinarum]MBD7939646.1 hypothetical protein [Cytobacillus stercorigallinarum]